MKSLVTFLKMSLMTAAAVVVALPIVVVCAAALNSGRSMLFPPQEPTLQRFSDFFLIEEVWKTALFNSVTIAVSSAVLAVAIAWPIAYKLWRDIVMFFVSASAYSTVTLQIFNSLRNGFTPTMAVGAITFIVTSLIVFSTIARFGDLPKLMGADQSKT